MKIEKDDFVLGLTFFLVVLVSMNTIKAKRNNFENILIGGIASEINQSNLAKIQVMFTEKLTKTYQNLRFGQKRQILVRFG